MTHYLSLGSVKIPISDTKWLPGHLDNKPSSKYKIKAITPTQVKQILQRCKMNQIKQAIRVISSEISIYEIFRDFKYLRLSGASGATPTLEFYKFRMELHSENSLVLDKFPKKHDITLKVFFSLPTGYEKKDSTLIVKYDKQLEGLYKISLKYGETALIKGYQTKAKEKVIILLTFIPTKNVIKLPFSVAKEKFMDTFPDDDNDK